jgi:hypothetical protein
LLFQMQLVQRYAAEGGEGALKIKKRSFPIFITIKWVANNLGVIVPGTNLVLEVGRCTLTPPDP